MLTRRAFAEVGLGGALMGLFGLLGCKRSASGYEGRLIRRVCYTSGGGMTGGSNSIELYRADDGTVTLSTRNKEWHNSRAKGMDYVIEADAFDRFAELANTYDLFGASKRKTSDLIALDAPSDHVFFDVLGEDGLIDIDASFSISSEQQLSKSEREGYRAVIDALIDLARTHEGTAYLEPRTLSFSLGGTVFDFVLNNSSASEDLASRTPLDVTLENHGENAKSFHLDEPLDTSDTPVATSVVGTVCYSAQDNEVIIFYGLGEATDGLYELAGTGCSPEIDFLADVEEGPCTVWSNN